MCAGKGGRARTIGLHGAKGATGAEDAILFEVLKHKQKLRLNFFWRITIQERKGGPWALLKAAIEKYFFGN